MPKILLVEDNLDSREGLARRLQRRGYEVVLACDGRQGATSSYRRSGPDLMDINLPVLDGWEATRLIRCGRDPRHPHHRPDRARPDERRQKTLRPAATTATPSPSNFRDC